MSSRPERSAAALLAGLAHALAYGALEHTAVERILLARAYPRRLDEYVAEQSAAKLRRAVLDSSPEPRDLAEYDALPCRGRSAPSQGDPPCPENAQAQAQRSGSGSGTTSNGSG